mmetsp:Transcript_461/g.1374  ORF Transcript_461/g.1374 Transcript_461/m.1374 type:complete len:111 (-) Transcript_461:2662-2994(-)
MVAKAVYLLLQPNHPDSRLYIGFESVSKAMSALCTRFEARVSELNPGIEAPTYQLEDIYSWIDTMSEMLIFVAEGGPGGSYSMQTRPWIKSRLVQHLLSLQQGGPPRGRR